MLDTLAVLGSMSLQGPVIDWVADHRKRVLEAVRARSRRGPDHAPHQQELRAGLAGRGAWHHDHHAFPQSAFHGLRWYEFDPSGWLILAMERVGLAWDVVKVTPERARAKLKSGTVSA